MKTWLLPVLLCAASVAQAQNPRVLLDTDYGPLVVELDAQRAPNTVANFLSYVDDGSFDNSIFHRSSRVERSGVAVVQGGAAKATGVAITAKPAINSERNNGLSNTLGTLSMALSNGSNGQPNVNSATSQFFINTGDNSTALDPNFTVFGRVTYGMKTLDAMKTTPLLVTAIPNAELPIRPPLIRRAVRTDGFPILDLHTGAWFDPAKAGRGFGVEVANEAGSESGPLIIVYWYDYFQGEQVWMNGVASFAYGASEVTIPMQITRGAQFGEAFNPNDVVSDGDWGTLTVRFTGCASAEFSYQSAFGNGSMQLQRLSLPANQSCIGQ